MKKFPTLFIIILNGSLLIGQFVLTNYRSVDGREVAAIRHQISVTSQANSQLKNQILQLSSIANLQQIAQNQSLVPLTVSIASPLSVAAAQP